MATFLEPIFENVAKKNNKKMLPMWQHFGGKRLKMLRKKTTKNVAYMATFFEQIFENVAKKKHQKNVAYLATFLGQALKNNGEKTTKKCCLSGNIFGTNF